MSDILKIEDLVIQYDTDSGCVHALNGLSLTLREGETLGLVGETGAGKTTLARSIMGLIQCPPGKIVSGKILYRGEDLLTMKEKHRQSIRGKEISMIFQDPMTSLNPVTTVGDQIAEAVMAMTFKASSEDIARICHAHPTLSEAVREAALAVDGRALNM